jgi:hypothetical protein
MNMIALQNRPQWIVIGTVVAAAAIGGILRLYSVQQAPSTTTNLHETAASSKEEVALFNSPMVSLSDQFQRAASPAELLISTPSEDRLSVVAAGRIDPFAPVTRTVGPPSSSQQVANRPNPGTASANTNSAGATPALPPVPASNDRALPPIPTVNIPSQPLPLPPIPVATSPISIPALPTIGSQSSPIPQDPLQSIELKGVVQVGNRVGIIVREADGQTSRHIFVGDYLAGGQIKVKSIDLSAQEPLVILEYQGKDYPRMVG